MLEHLFTSGTRIRALSLLLFHQNQEYHLREIARLVGASPIYVSKELNNLVKLNIIKKSKKANLSIFSLNKECIILKELRGIFLKTEYLGEAIREELHNKAEFCFIYGSFPKGEETERSDIDLFLVASIKEDELISLIQKIEKAVQREVNYVLWNRKTFEQRASQGHHLLRSIKRSKIIMLIGDEHEFKKQIR